MPGKWSTKGLKETGFNAIVFFRGKLTRVEEDLPSKFTEKDGSAKLQTKLSWSDVELLAWESPIALEDGKLTKFVNQSTAKRSTWGRMITDFEQYANKAALQGVLPDCFLGADLIWGRKSYEMGKDASPGVAYVPFAAGAEVEKFRKGLITADSVDTEKVAEGGTKSSGPAVPESVDQEVIDAALAVIPDDGTTKETVRKALIGKASLRTAVAKVGGVDAVLAYLVANDKVVQDGETYLAVPAEAAEPVAV